MAIYTDEMGRARFSGPKGRAAGSGALASRSLEAQQPVRSFLREGFGFLRDNAAGVGRKALGVFAPSIAPAVDFYSNVAPKMVEGVRNEGLVPFVGRNTQEAAGAVTGAAGRFLFGPEQQPAPTVAPTMPVAPAMAAPAMAPGAPAVTAPRSSDFQLSSGSARFLGSRSMASDPAMDRMRMEAQFGRPGQTNSQNQATMSDAQRRLDVAQGRTPTAMQQMQSQEQMAKYGMLAEAYKTRTAQGEDPNKAAMGVVSSFFEGGGTVQELPQLIAALGLGQQQGQGGADANGNGVPDDQESLYQNALLAEQMYNGKEATLTGEQLARLNKARNFRKEYEKKYRESLGFQ